MKSRLATLLAVPVLLSAVAAPGIAQEATTPASAASGLSDTGARAFSELAGCISDRDAVLVSFVVDESMSLRETDPDASRTDALLTAFDALAALNDGAAGKSVEANVSSFAVDVSEQVPWGRVTGSHLERLEDFATRAADLNGGLGTDHRKGLDAARRDLQTRAAQLEAEGVSSCQAVVFFTDGELDVDDKRGNAAAQSELCDQSGIADGLRQQGATVIAVSLLPEDASADDTGDRTLLQAVAEGEAPGQTCGVAPIPNTSSAGAYLPASGASSLASVFATALSRAEGYGDGPGVECPGPGCPDGRFEFPVDPGVDSVRLLARSIDGAPVALSLVLPDGTTVALPADTTLDESGVTGAWRGQLAQLTADVNEAGTGNWTVLIDGGRAEVQAFYLTRFTATTSDAEAFLRAGETTSVPLNISRAAGANVRLEDYSDLKVTARIDGGEAQPLSRVGAMWELQAPLPESGFPTEVPVTVDVSATTAQSGIELPVASTSFAIPVRPPTAFPSLESAALTFNVEGTAPASASLEARGSDDGPTTIQINDVRATGPASAGELRFAHPVDPIDLDAGEPYTIAITLEPENAADGTASGEASITLRGANGEETVQTVPVEASLVRPVNEAIRWPLVVAFTLLSIAVPYALVLLFTGRSARFANTTTARAYTVPVMVRPTGLDGRDDGARLVVDGDRHAGRLNATQPHAKRLSVPATTVALSASLKKWPPHAVRPTASATAGPQSWIAALDMSRDAFVGPDDTVPVSLGMGDTALLVGTPADSLAGPTHTGAADRPVPATLVLLRLDPSRQTFDSWREDTLMALRQFPDWQLLHERLATRLRARSGPDGPTSPPPPTTPTGPPPPGDLAPSAPGWGPPPPGAAMTPGGGNTPPPPTW